MNYERNVGVTNKLYHAVHNTCPKNSYLGSMENNGNLPKCTFNIIIVYKEFDSMRKHLNFSRNQLSIRSCWKITLILINHYQKHWIKEILIFNLLNLIIGLRSIRFTVEDVEWKLNKMLHFFFVIWFSSPRLTRKRIEKTINVRSLIAMICHLFL